MAQTIFTIHEQTCSIYCTSHNLVIFTVHDTNFYSMECHTCTLEEVNRTSFMSPQWYLLPTCSGMFLAISSEIMYIQHMKITAGCTFVLHMC